jgi:hypothetical protein
MNPSKDQKDRSAFWMVAFFFSLIGTGMIFIYWFQSKFIHSLSEAAIIAGILGLTVDHYVKKRLVREAARDIDKYLLGYALPGELREKISEARYAKVVRRKFECTYTILPIAGEKRIKLETDLTFEVENITSRIQEYTAELELENHCLPEIELMSCECHYDRKQEYEFKGSGWTLNEKGATVEVTARRVQLLPKGPNHYVTYKFRHKYRQTFPATGSEYFKFDQPYPTIGAKIIVLHPNQFKIHFSSKAHVEEAERAEWNDPKVFLHGEIITVWWRVEGN